MVVKKKSKIHKKRASMRDSKKKVVKKNVFKKNDFPSGRVIPPLDVLTPDSDHTLKEKRIDTINWTLIHTLELEERVMDFVIDSRSNGSTFEQIEQTLRNARVPNEVIQKIFFQLRVGKKAIVPRGILWGLIFSIMLLLLILTAVIFFTISPECGNNLECPQGMICVDGDCQEILHSLECQKFLEPDGTRGDDFYRCLLISR